LRVNWKLILIIPIIASACGISERPQLGTHGIPIINGTLDTNPDHQAVVAMTFGGGYMCTGTLISSDVILTAAHCADGYSSSSYTIYFGNYLSSASQRGVTDIHVHPQYNEYSITNDIALLRLSSAPPSNINPIPFLPSSLEINQADVSDPLEYVGFGETETHTTGAKLTVTNDLDWICTNSSGCVVGPGYQASANTICGDQSPGGPCHGDSGGPAFIERSGQEYVAGVTSYGDQYCQYFGCSTKVDEFETFITDYIGGQPGDTCINAGACLSGYCVDGVCCQAACGGECMACNVSGSLGTCAPVPNGTACPDSDACNGIEVCMQNECVAGDPLNCDDHNICTHDSCNPSSGCSHGAVVDGTSCSNDDVCDGLETCQAGACLAGETLNCDDHNPCSLDSCDSLTGCQHEYQPDGTSCGGGLCGPSTCLDGFCTPDDFSVCDDGDSCTRDTCDPGSGCLNQVLPDGYGCGDCMMCMNAECVENDDCIIRGGCGCGNYSADSIGWQTVLAFFVFFPIICLRRRKTTG